MITALTHDQKLQALALKYYNCLEWEPKKGDYYTTCRADLELYQIVDEDEFTIYTVYCDPGAQGDHPPAQWPKSEFLKHFGEKRVWVPEFILYPTM